MRRGYVARLVYNIAEIVFGVQDVYLFRFELIQVFMRMVRVKPVSGFI